MDSTITVNKDVKKKFNIKKVENDMTSNELLLDLMGNLNNEDKEMMKEAADLLWLGAVKIRRNQIGEALPKAMEDLHYKLYDRIGESND